MRLVLKNLTKQGIKASFRGREIWFGPKQAQTFDMEDEEEKAKYFFWKDTYGFIIDITRNLRGVNNDAVN
jgi:hypothetical protein